MGGGWQPIPSLPKVTLISRFIFNLAVDKMGNLTLLVAKRLSA
jgi:hypothetical protein